MKNHKTPTVFLGRGEMCAGRRGGVEEIDCHDVGPHRLHRWEFTMEFTMILEDSWLGFGDIWGYTSGRWGYLGIV